MSKSGFTMNEIYLLGILSLDSQRGEEVKKQNLLLPTLMSSSMINEVA